MINEQELAEAVDRLREGEIVLGVSCEDVYRSMYRKEKLIMVMMSDIHGGNKFLLDGFLAAFSTCAESILREAYRTKLEHEAGL